MGDAPRLGPCQSTAGPMGRSPKNPPDFPGYSAAPPASPTRSAYRDKPLSDRTADARDCSFRVLIELDRRIVELSGSKVVQRLQSALGARPSACDSSVALGQHTLCTRCQEFCSFPAATARIDHLGGVALVVGRGVGGTGWGTTKAVLSAAESPGREGRRLSHGPPSRPNGPARRRPRRHGCRRPRPRRRGWRRGRDHRVCRCGRKG